jgi:FG-GAP-like repeat
MFSPQLADYDGDGLLDVISGSSRADAGGFYVFRRLKDGGFAPRQQVKLVYPREQFDVVITRRMGSCIAVADLNGDGNQDVLIGADQWRKWDTFGIVYGPLAGKDQLTVQRIWPKGHELFPPITRMSTNPVLADWDGDGLPDLILGVSKPSTDRSGRLGVYWCRNVGTKRAPKFGPPQLLVADNERVRTTGICVADWNGDGSPDLIASRIVRDKEGGARPWHQKVWVYLRRGG